MSGIGLVSLSLSNRINKIFNSYKLINKKKRKVLSGIISMMDDAASPL